MALDPHQLQFVPAVGDGSCAIHSMTGTYDYSFKKLFCTDFQTKRNQIAEEIRKSLSSSSTYFSQPRFREAITESIMTIVYDHDREGARPLPSHCNNLLQFILTCQKANVTNDQKITCASNAFFSEWQKLESSHSKSCLVKEYKSGDLNSFIEVFRASWYHSETQSRVRNFVEKNSALNLKHLDYNRAIEQNVKYSQPTQDVLDDYADIYQCSDYYLMSTEVVIVAIVLDISMKLYTQSSATKEYHDMHTEYTSLRVGASPVFIVYNGVNHYDRLMGKEQWKLIEANLPAAVNANLRTTQSDFAASKSSSDVTDSTSDEDDEEVNTSHSETESEDFKPDHVINAEKLSTEFPHFSAHLVDLLSDEKLFQSFQREKQFSSTKVKEEVGSILKDIRLPGMENKKETIKLTKDNLERYLKGKDVKFPSNCPKAALQVFVAATAKGVRLDCGRNNLFGRNDRRDAVASIAGIAYQAQQSLRLWLELKHPNQAIVCEGVEDADIIEAKKAFRVGATCSDIILNKDPQAVSKLIHSQMKHSLRIGDKTSDGLSLSDEDVKKCIAQCVELMHNSQFRFQYSFVARHASPRSETNGYFKDQKLSAIIEWERLQQKLFSNADVQLTAASVHKLCESLEDSDLKSLAELWNSINKICSWAADHINFSLSVEEKKSNDSSEDAPNLTSHKVIKKSIGVDPNNMKPLTLSKFLQLLWTFRWNISDTSLAQHRPQICESITKAASGMGLVLSDNDAEGIYCSLLRYVWEDVLCVPFNVREPLTKSSLDEKIWKFCEAKCWVHDHSDSHQIVWKMIIDDMDYMDKAEAEKDVIDEESNDVEKIAQYNEAIRSGMIRMLKEMIQADKKGYFSRYPIWLQKLENNQNISPKACNEILTQFTQWKSDCNDIFE